ncbi:MAG: M14 family zinc carboxypeptidase [Bacteroidota bacterium]
MKKYLLLLSLVLVVSAANAQVVSPAEFFGYEIGERFTKYHRVVDYFTKLSDDSDQVKLMEYGKTKEGRPLILAFISSAENINNLEEIRKSNLKRARVLDGNAEGNTGVVWMSYSVHGNESSTTEAAIKTIHQLLTDSKFSKYLENTVVIMDPCLNPDGRERYVHFFEQWQNSNYNTNPDAAEHNEPWPGGRINHYLFDLNRDWAWQTQLESQQRMVVYNQWLPQIHADFHEQFINNPYYFAPAAAPYHQSISNWQRDFQLTIGKNHAKYFDENGWLYFSKEVFDLLYPSYGDTYPMFNGAIGMTYEQAGHGLAGLGIDIADGQVLTLKDRAAHHTVTGLSTVEAASVNNKKMLDEFTAYFDKSVKGQAVKYKSFVIKNTNQDRINHMMNWLDKLGIQYGNVSAPKNLKGYHYQTKRTTSYTLSSNDLVIPLNQPKAILANVLFEPKTAVEDSLTYDITAWSAPFFYGLDTYANDVTIDRINEAKPVNSSFEETNSPYALIAKYNSLKDGEFLAALLNADLKVRLLNNLTEVEGKTFEPGSIVITKTSNEDGYEKIVYDLAKAHNRKVEAVSTGFVNIGKDLGSASVSLLEKPEIAVIGGEGTSALSFGPIRFYFEQEVKYPYTVIRTDYLSSTDLDQYNIIVMPSGSYSNVGDSFSGKLNKWVRSGGKLILIESALNRLKDNDRSALSTYFDDEEKKRLKNDEVTKEMALATNEDKSRNWLESAIPGAIYQVTLDGGHKLAYGLEGDYYSLKTRGSRFAYMKNGSNVGTIRSKSDLMGGYVGAKAQERLNETLVFGTERKGSGSMIYFIDNPLFRSFWYEGKVLFTNAVFLAD